MLPSAGLEAAWRINHGLGLHAGLHYALAYILPSRAGEGSGSSPHLWLPVPSLGVSYRISPGMALQADTRYLSLSSGALPGLQASRSNGWLIGVGLRIGL